MLILTRKIGEKIKIGDDVVLSVVEMGKGYVKLGIEAPKDIAILRQEVFERVRDENIASAKAGIAGLFKAADIMRKVGKSSEKQDDKE